MNKLTSLTLFAGLAIAFTTVGASAAVVIAKPPVTHSSGIQYDPCDTMGHMRRVSASDIQAIEPWQSVALISVCEDMTVESRNYYGSLFNNGNVNAVRLPIARSEALMDALQAKGYDQNDVVNLRFGANDSVLLYVHQRDMR